MKKKHLDQPSAVAGAPMDVNELTALSTYISTDTFDYFYIYCKRLKNATTKKDYGYLLAHFCNECKNDFLSLTSSQVSAYFSKNKTKYAIASMTWQIAVLRSFARFLDEELTPAEEENKQHYQNLFPIFSFEKIPQEAADAPPLRAVDHVLTWLLQNGHISAFTAISLVLRCALTCSEVCSLYKGSFIRDKKDHVGIVFPGPQNRYIKIPPDLHPLIAILVADTDDADTPVFRTKRYQRPMTKRSLERVLQEACAQAGVPGFSLQQLRNLSIGTMLAGGASAIQVSDYIGTSLNWISRYEKCIPELEYAAVDFNQIRIVAGED